MHDQLISQNLSSLTRRQFLGRTAAGAAMGWGLSRSAWSAEDAKSAKAKLKYPYIDMHTHIGTFYPGQELTADGLVELMDENGIERAVILPLISPESTIFLQTNEDAIRNYKLHPDRLIPFCCIDPRCSTTNPKRYGHVAGVQGITDLLKRYQEMGAKGVGEHKVGLPFDHPQMMMLYEACSNLSLPMLFHLDDIRSFDTPGLPRLENVLKAFPKLILMGHAAGFWASISADATFEDFGRYPEIPTPTIPGGALDTLMEKYPNRYGDLSEPGGEKAIARDPKFGREFIIRRADQLVFGTDYLMANQKIPQFELLDSLDLPEEVQYKIYRGNAIKILNLEDLKE
ncbi:MAG: amidohydrolase family protein [Planctomycetaceae bacterium]